MEENAQKVDPEFKDLKGDVVQVGSVIIYAVQTQMRLGRVYDVKDRKNAMVHYPAFTWEYIAAQGYRKAYTIKRQLVNLGHRGVILVKPEEVDRFARGIYTEPDGYEKFCQMMMEKE